MTVEEWLIDAVKQRPIIWNTKDENYKNTKMKNQAYDEIAKESDMEASEIKKKWHSIRSAFSRELRMRTLYSTMDSSGQKRQWKHFNKLMFLHDECVEYDINGPMVESEVAVSIMSEDDGSSTLYNLTNSNTSSPTNENGQRESSRSQNAKQSTKRRKTNLNSSSALNLRQVTQNASPLTKSLNNLSEEEIFGHSIAMSLKKFDDKKKEVVKLKLQEVIVQYLNND